MVIELSLDVLNRFLNELLKSKDSYTFTDKGLLLIVQALDSNERFWHVESDVLWRKDSWKVEHTRISKLKLEQEEYNRILHARKEALDRLRRGISDHLGIPNDDACKVLALKFLSTNNVAAAKIFGVDISELESLGVKHTVIEGNTSYDL